MKRAGGMAGGALAAGLALAVTWLAFDVVVLAYGESPAALLSMLLRGTWGTPYGLGQVLYKATPLLFAGVAVAVALRAGLFNVGVEGQLTVGSLAAAVVASRLPNMSPWLSVGIALAAASAAGAAWALPAAVLRARYGVHEVISTILSNRIAESMVTFALAAGLAVPGSVRTPDVAKAARLAKLEMWAPALSGSAVSLALPLAIVVVVVVALVSVGTRFGVELEQVGLGPEACAAERIPVARRRLQAMLVSGGLAGLVASATVLGFKGAFEQGLGGGVGFVGIAVALLGRGSAVGLIVAALLLGTLQQGGLVINGRVPMEIVDVLSAVLIVSMALFDRVIVPRFARVRGEAVA